VPITKCDVDCFWQRFEQFEQVLVVELVPESGKAVNGVVDAL
jgi:hypothetical protein